MDDLDQDLKKLTYDDIRYYYAYFDQEVEKT